MIPFDMVANLVLTAAVLFGFLGVGVGLFTASVIDTLRKGA